MFEEDSSFVVGRKARKTMFQGNVLPWEVGFHAHFVGIIE